MRRRTVAGYRESFALKPLGSGDFRLDKQTHGGPVGDTADGDQRRAAKNRTHHGVARPDAHVQITAHPRLNGNTAGTDINQLRLEPVLLEGADLLRHPHASENRADGGISDGNLWRALRR